jgi:D-glycero-D-manno-heptose 1,7-bisphosphate phosphatase
LPSESRAVFLDRDGVLNAAIVEDGKPYPPTNLSELVIDAATPELLARLKGRGFKLIVVTNQPDVGRGLQKREAVEAINDVLRERLPLDELLVCYHDGTEECDCRKPAPGLLLSAAERHGIALGASYMVGDRWRDVEAGQRAGCKTIWIDLSYRERKPNAYDACVQTLEEAVNWILDDGETA